MTIVEIKTYRGEFAEAEVTCCRIGESGWHIHATYTDAGEPRRQHGLCGDAKTLTERGELFARSCELAKRWAAAR